MKIYNTNDAYGNVGPFEADNFSALADEMQPQFEIWAEEAWNDDFDLTMMCHDEFVEEEISNMRTDFISGLTVEEN